MDGVKACSSITPTVGLLFCDVPGRSLFIMRKLWTDKFHCDFPSFATLAFLLLIAEQFLIGADTNNFVPTGQTRPTKMGQPIRTALGVML